MHSNSYSCRAFTFIELMIALLVTSVVVIGMARFLKAILTKTATDISTTSAESELSRFEQLMLSDLVRAGNDPTTLALEAYQAMNQGCTRQKFTYGLVSYPTDSSCKRILGQIGILSYQGLDVNRNGKFFPEEGLKLDAPALRPPAPTGVDPAPPNPLPVNFYNDYIVYQWDIPEDVLQSTVMRKNIGKLSDTTDDFQEVVLRNVVSFIVNFEMSGNSKDDLDLGTDFHKVTVQVTIRSPNPDPLYNNPQFPDSPFSHYRTQTREFTFSVIRNAEAVY